MSQPLLYYACVMGTAAGAAMAVYPFLERFSLDAAHRVSSYQKVKFKKATKELDDIFLYMPPKWLKWAYGAGPVIGGVLTWCYTRNLLLALIAAAFGALLPDMYVRNLRAMRRVKFANQLVDSLFVLSSSLRAGLSLPQSVEQLALEMPAPASDEFGLVIKAHRLGRPLEDALEGLNERMKLEDLNLVTTAIVLARETGGDVTQVINQLISTIRERKKLFDKVNTLTVQGRFQAYIMSGLPVMFALFVRSFNKDYFAQMLSEDTGRMLIVLAVILWIVGVILLRITSKVEF